MLTKGLNL